MPRIIVLLSTWNGEKYLRKQLDSLLAQTVIDQIQILVRDDGSSDGTIGILKEYEKTGKLRFYQGKNLGSTQSFFQLLIDAPEADFYAFSDQDDYWLPEKVEKAVKGIEGIKGPALFCSRKIIVDQDLRRLNREDVDPSTTIMDNFIRSNRAFGCTMLMNRELRKIFLRYRPQVVPFHDSWLFKLALFFGKIVYSKESYILYRQHGNNVTGAQEYGFRLFLHRIKNFDPTFVRYRNRQGARIYAEEMLKGYRDCLSSDDRKVLGNIVNVKNSFKSRIQLLGVSGLTKHPLYDYIAQKCFILLGWL